ncbi:unnamed protein product [Penicillium salamii]|nr:unnamed protein product [Penicillium salamii]
MSQPNPNERIQVDTSDDDSLFDSQSLLGSSLSFASSVRDYNYENGRRYHAYRNGQYPFPNDEEEQDRLALTHHLFKLLLGGSLHRAPIASATRILDIGTGTGEWALEMAELHPQAYILGTDLSPIQPSWAPPNCRFFIDDAESDWTFDRDEKFDFIHARSLAGGVGDWPRLLKQAFTNLKPGGWFEAQEFDLHIVSEDGTHEEATALATWKDLLVKASTKFGKPMDVVTQLEEWMGNQGFRNFRADKYKCPVGGWAKNHRLKDIGRVGKVILLEIVEPYTLALFTRVLGFSYQDAQELMEQVRAELVSNSYHLYTTFHFIYGQKPL